MMSSMSVAGMRETDPDRRSFGFSLEVRQRDVIAIADSGFGGVGRNHAVARIVE